MRRPSNRSLSADQRNDLDGPRLADPGVVPRSEVVDVRESAGWFSALPNEVCGRSTTSSNIVLMVCLCLLGADRQKDS